MTKTIRNLERKLKRLLLRKARRRHVDRMLGRLNSARATYQRRNG